MYCRKCGGQNDDNAFQCVHCGEVLQYHQPPPITTDEVPNYLVHAILVTIFCCMPFGVVGIVYAALVNAQLQMGNLEAATDLSNKARKWCIASFSCGIVVAVLYPVIIVLSIIFEA